MDKAVHDLYKGTNDDQQKVIAPNDGSSTSAPPSTETVGQSLVGQQATKPIKPKRYIDIIMDHAVVQNEKQQTDIKTNVSDDAKSGGVATASQPADTRTLQGTIANEANPTTNPR